MTMTTLKSALLDILNATEDPDFRPLIGGGYGMYLKYQMVLKEGTRTLLAKRPEARSTNNIDMFLRTELLVNGARLEPFKAALENLGYEAVPSAKYYQFAKPGPDGGRAGGLKVDLLAGPQNLLKEMGLKVDARRVRANPKVEGLHAHPVDEAPTLEAHCTSTTIQGELSSGGTAEAVVLLPHPFSFLTMKLFALRDRVNDVEKDLGRHHALDIYTVLSLTSEEEWGQCRLLRKEHADNPFIIEACGIAREFFGDDDAIGVIRIKEHAYYSPELQLEEFRQALLELFA